MRLARGNFIIIIIIICSSSETSAVVVVSYSVVLVFNLQTGVLVNGVRGAVRVDDVACVLL